MCHDVFQEAQARHEREAAARDRSELDDLLREHADMLAALKEAEAVIHLLHESGDFRCHADLEQCEWSEVADAWRKVVAAIARAEGR